MSQRYVVELEYPNFFYEILVDLLVILSPTVSRIPDFDWP